MRLAAVDFWVSGGGTWPSLSCPVHERSLSLLAFIEWLPGQLDLSGRQIGRNQRCTNLFLAFFRFWWGEEYRL